MNIFFVEIFFFKKGTKQDINLIILQKERHRDKLFMASRDFSHPKVF